MNPLAPYTGRNIAFNSKGVTVMQKTLAVFLFFVLVLGSGCFVRSLHPIYMERDLVFEPALLGEWSEAGSKEVWTFSREGANGYLFVHTDEEGRRGDFRSGLAKIGDVFFLDLVPVGPDARGNLIHDLHFLPVHSFLHLERIAPTLRMRAPDPDWLERFLAAHPEALSHETIDGDIVLTAPTGELQAFWLKHLGTEGAFGDASEMTRRAEAP